MFGKVVLATHNQGKVRELRAVLADLHLELAGLREYGEIPAVAETGMTFAENARLKALYYARKTGQLCLADDSGLAVDALDGAPGVYSARYAADLAGPDATGQEVVQANNKRLMEVMSDIEEDKRTCRFVCHMALAEPGRVLLEATGKVEGVVATALAGDNGFGYDPLFFLPQYDKTMAQLPPAEKNRISHRARAVAKLRIALEEMLSDSSKSD